MFRVIVIGLILMCYALTVAYGLHYLLMWLLYDYEIDNFVVRIIAIVTTYVLTIALILVGFLAVISPDKFSTEQHQERIITLYSEDGRAVQRWKASGEVEQNDSSCTFTDTQGNEISIRDGMVVISDQKLPEVDRE